jgi:peptidoglycan/LPS O-acetylase OafA/YrhL
MLYTTIQILFFSASFALALFIARPVAWIFRIQSEKREYEFLDGIRGISAIAVATCHINQHLLSFLGFSALPETGNRIGILGLQIFFSLSAFLFTKQALDGILKIKNFYIQRIRRIMPLYVFASAATIFFCLYYSPYPPDAYNKLLQQSLDVLAYGTIGGISKLEVQGYNALTMIGVAWSLSYEWKFYIIFPGLVYLYRKSPLTKGMTLVVAGFLAFRDFSNTGEVVWPFFAPGILVAFMARNNMKFSQFWKIILCVITLPLIGLAAAMKGYFNWQHLLIVTGIFFCLFFAEPRFLAAPTFRVLGQMSFSIYLLHCLVLTPALENFYFYQGQNLGTWPKFSIAVLINLAVIPIAALCYRLIEIRKRLGRTIGRLSRNSLMTCAG